MASVLKVDKLDPQSGTALEIGTSGDTITVPSGATFTVSGTMNASSITAGTLAVARGGTGAATLAAAGLVNTPYFLANVDSDDAIADATWTVVEFDSEIYDSEGSYDTTTFRWTPQVAGYYWLHGSAGAYNSGTDIYEISVRLRVNGSAKAQQFFRNEDTFSYAALNCSTIFLLNGSTDYVDFQILADTTGAASQNSGGIQNTFCGFRLIS